MAELDDERFLRVLDKCAQPLINYLWKYLGSRYDAEDAAADAFVKLYRRVKRFDSDDKLTAYLYRTATNIANNIKRRKKISRIFSFALLRKKEDGNTDSIVENIADSDEKNPAVSYEDERKRKIIRDAISRLPPYQRAAIILFYYEGKTYQEISAILKKSIPSVESLIFRARSNLSRILSGFLV